MRLAKERRELLLLGWVVRECNTLLDVALQAFHAGVEEGLLVLVEVGEWVLGLFSPAGLFACQYYSANLGEGGSYAKLDRNGEEVTACLLRNGLAPWDTG